MKTPRPRSSLLRAEQFAPSAPDGLPQPRHRRQQDVRLARLDALERPDIQVSLLGDLFLRDAPSHPLTTQIRPEGAQFAFDGGRNGHGASCRKAARHQIVAMKPIAQPQPSAPTINANVGETLGLALAPSPLPMVDALLASGFNRVENGATHSAESLRYHHPQLDLTASRVLGRHFRPVVQLCGSYRSEGGRCFGMVEYQLPEEVESLAVAQAFLACAIDGSGSPDFLPAPLIPWLSDGRRHRPLLPWEREPARLMEIEAACPKCTVSRDWLRLGLKTLHERLSHRADVTVVTFGFDGRYFSIAGVEYPILLPANGTGPWPQAMSVAVRDLHLLPRRLMRDSVSIVVHPDGLRIDHAPIPYAASSNAMPSP